MSEPKTVPMAPAERAFMEQRTDASMRGDACERAERLVWQLSYLLEELRVAVNELTAERSGAPGHRREDDVSTLMFPDPEPATGVHSLDSLGSHVTGRFGRRPERR
ncbi:hypothetical protein [Actinomadura gamaensis]|uniref:Uncharacterized protein n=1 Tax=Actinomadura gamaensis TaxID=1763541 RepID=A0ABV9U0J7_9ACTN